MLRDATTFKLYPWHTADISPPRQTIKKVITKVHYYVVIHTLGSTPDLRRRMGWALYSSTHEGVGQGASL